MQAYLNPNNIDDYRLFLRIKALPKYRIVGRMAEFPDEYADLLGMERDKPKASAYHASKFLFDYQRDIAKIAIKKQKFAVFAECGLGKTMIMLEFANHTRRAVPKKKTLIVSPAMVVRQTLQEAVQWYGKSCPIRRIQANELGEWLTNNDMVIGITNYEAIVENLPTDKLGALLLDEASLLKSHYGAWGTRLIKMGKGLDWKLCLTGTPAPNDRIEYANHAVFLDAFPTVNSFLARFFINRGQTGERWELKPHALKPFYRALSHWCIFLTNPATYGWKDNTENIPPIHVHIDDVPMTKEQWSAVQSAGGNLYGQVGGITSRSKMAQIAKGHFRGKKYETLKPAFIKSMVDSWTDESTIIWCRYNPEQEIMEKVFPDAASLKGETPYEERERLIEDFKAGRRKEMVSKAKVLGYGLNLQIATRHVFSALEDSYEQFWQCIKRSNRIGSTKPLNVHIPVTEVERPMIETVLSKARRVQEDTETQEKLFKEIGYEFAA